MAENKHIQKTLVPILLEKGMPGFEAVQDIEEKLNDPEVFNIAITGPYGSGKSTVLKSLKAQFPDSHNYLTISLASLTGDIENDVDNENNKALTPDEQQKVEYSLLQQLIYKEKPETLPNSRFRRIGRRSIKKSVWFGLGIISFLISFLVVFEPQWMKVESFCRIFDFGNTWNLVSDIVCTVYMLLFVFKVAAYMFRHSTFSRVKALNVKDVIIELNQDSSVFNKHLEEIVYFFESTDYNVVIIEDLDRFRCPEIFQKLREINFLLRQSEVLKAQNRHVKFIYAIKDDLFKDAERTKFFDYIATVIPVVNPKNSCEKLTQELMERGYTVDKDTLRDLSEYVDDMRMLKNVANEFQQYMERLSTSSSPNKEMLLAMIIYKNHHPDDFGQLHYKKGKVYEFIKLKSEWVQIAIDKVIKPKLEIWQKKKEETINSQKFTLKQWRILYMGKYREHLSSAMTHIAINGTMQPLKAIEDTPDLFESLIKLNRVNIRTQSYYDRQSQTSTVDVKFADIEKEVDDKIGYLKRKELSETPTSDIDNEIRMVRDEENRLRNFKLAKLLVQFPEIKKSEKFVGIGLSDLMIHFLQRGYIDETYYDYLTLYDGTTMSLNDRGLLSRIRQNDINVNYDEQIDDIEAFVEELPLFVYDYKSVLNYQIADFLESHPVIYKSALQGFEQHFVATSSPALDFLANYYKREGNGASKLWRKYVKSDMSWQRIQTYDKQEYWDVLVEAWLRNCEKSDITESVKAWLNSNLGFCIERLKALGVGHLKELINDCVFEEIASLGPIGGQFQGEDVMDVADYILENKLFELTVHNLLTACLVSSSPFDDLKDVDYLTMSDILSSGNEGFKEYIRENIKDVFANFIYSSKGQESETGLVFIVNNEEIDESQKLSYLKRQTKDKIFNLQDVNDGFKPLAIKSNVLNARWENVLNYYEFDDNKISGDLEQFINDNVDELLKDEYPAGGSSEFVGKLMYGMYLEVKTYEKLLPFLVRHSRKSDESMLSIECGIERIMLLVKGNYLSSNTDTGHVVAQFGVPVYAMYLTYHINDFIAGYENYDINTKTLTVLLDRSSSLTNGQRWNLAKKVSVDLIKQDKELANVLLLLMLRRKEELSFDTLLAVLGKASLQPQKQQFQKWLIKRYPESREKEISIIKTMDYPYYEIIEDSKRPLIPFEFKEYLDLLKPLGLYTSYKPEKKGLRVFHSTK